MDTTAPDLPSCDPPSVSGDPHAPGALADTALQATESERELCVANNEVGDGTVMAVIAQPVAYDPGGNPVGVTLSMETLPNTVHIEVDMPAIIGTGWSGNGKLVDGLSGAAGDYLEEPDYTSGDLP